MSGVNKPEDLRATEQGEKKGPSSFVNIAKMSRSSSRGARFNDDIAPRPRPLRASTGDLSGDSDSEDSLDFSTGSDTERERDLEKGTRSQIMRSMPSRTAGRARESSRARSSSRARFDSSRAGQDATAGSARTRQFAMGKPDAKPKGGPSYVPVSGNQAISDISASDSENDLSDQDSRLPPPATASRTPKPATSKGSSKKDRSIKPMPISHHKSEKSDQDDEGFFSRYKWWLVGAVVLLLIMVVIIGIVLYTNNKSKTEDAGVDSLSANSTESMSGSALHSSDVSSSTINALSSMQDMTAAASSSIATGSATALVSSKGGWEDIVMNAELTKTSDEVNSALATSATVSGPASESTNSNKSKSDAHTLEHKTDNQTPMDKTNATASGEIGESQPTPTATQGDQQHPTEFNDTRKSQSSVIDGSQSVAPAQNGDRPHQSASTNPNGTGLSGSVPAPTANPQGDPKEHENSDILLNPIDNNSHDDQSADSASEGGETTAQSSKPAKPTLDLTESQTQDPQGHDDHDWFATIQTVPHASATQIKGSQAPVATQQASSIQGPSQSGASEHQGNHQITNDNDGVDAILPAPSNAPGKSAPSQTTGNMNGTDVPLVVNPVDGGKSDATKPGASADSGAGIGNGSNNQAGDGVRYHGRATWFQSSQHLSACHTVFSDADMVAALHPELYGLNGTVSAFCGALIHVLNPLSGATVSVVIQDNCPMCQGDLSLDLSKTAFEQLGLLDTGVIQVQWWWDDTRYSTLMPQDLQDGIADPVSEQELQEIVKSAGKPFDEVSADQQGKAQSGGKPEQLAAQGGEPIYQAQDSHDEDDGQWHEAGSEEANANEWH
ncbi:hypothetical protein OIO90_003184 [Microbotryomycetes sp. JL221]|nr:hypothetical protein OIO90_003184 [Microbotryomycetes sp. JL221]